MKSKGCIQAINLDGGGSSIPLYSDAQGRAVIANKPSDRSARPVPVMIGVRERARSVPPQGRTGPGKE